MLFRYANRHDFIARPSNCLSRAIFLSLSFFHLSLSLSLSLLFFVICTPNRAELLQYGSGGGGGSAGSRKSQINPFVIPHRSFQPVRISTTRFYATSAPSQNSSFPLASPYRPVKRENYSIVSIFFSLVAFSRLALPYFHHFFFFYPPFLLVFRCIFAQPARSFGSSFFLHIFSLYSVRPYRVISVRVSAARSNRVCFVCFSCMNLNSDFLPFIRAIITISGAAGCDWKRDSSEFRNYVRHSRERQPELVVMPNGENETKRFIETTRTKRFFKLFVFLFLAKSRTIALVHRVLCAAPSLLWYIYRAIIISSSVFSFGSDDRSFELCRAMPRLLIAIKERQFGKYEKIRDFFLPERRRLSSSSHRVTFIRLMSSHFLS